MSYYNLPFKIEQKDAIIQNGILSDKLDLKGQLFLLRFKTSKNLKISIFIDSDDYDLLNRQLENQTKINSQLTNEIEKLKSKYLYIL